MENKRNISKRIFSLFLVILCTFGILFVSYKYYFADDFSISFDTDSAFSDQSRHLTIIDVTDNVTLYDVTFSSQTYSISIPLSDHVYSISVYRIKPDGNHVYAYYIRFNYSNLTNTLLSRDPSSPSVISNLDITRFYVYSWSSDSNYTPYICYFRFDSSIVPTPTPTLEPTPTPVPATPTPNPYGPGPVPTIPPGEQSYTDFFSRLASDAQSAFNVIFLSWNNANSRFYSGIFFIGFPILLGIIGLVASIFFGDDD